MDLKLTEEKAISAIDNGGVVVLDFFAVWCNPCRTLSPKIEALSEKYNDKITVGKIDIEECDNLVEKYGIRNIPTVLFFKNGIQMDKEVGSVQLEALEQKVETLLNT